MRRIALALTLLAACADEPQSLGANGPARFADATDTRDGGFVAVGDDVAWSRDGLTWESADIALNGSLRAVAGAAERLVAVGGDEQFVSDDRGATWTSLSIGVSVDFTDVAYDPAHGFRAAAKTLDGMTRVFSSPDGVEWRALAERFPVAEPRLSFASDWILYDRSGGTIITDRTYVLPVDEIVGVDWQGEAQPYGFGTIGGRTVSFEPDGRGNWILYARPDDPVLRCVHFGYACAADGIYVDDGDHGSEFVDEIRFTHVETSPSWTAFASDRGARSIVVGDGIAMSDDRGQTWAQVLE